MKGEAPGDQTVTSHKALFTKDTHAPPSLPLPNASVHQSLTLPKCQGRDLGDSVNSTPRLVGWGHKQRAEKEEKGREVERLRQRGESGDWMVQYAKPILIGDCSAMSCFSWEYVKGRDRRVGRYGCFPRSWTAGLTTGAKLNSGLGHWKQIPGYHHHTRPPRDLLQSACNYQPYPIVGALWALPADFTGLSDHRGTSAQTKR